MATLSITASDVGLISGSSRKYTVASSETAGVDAGMFVTLDATQQVVKLENSLNNTAGLYGIYLCLNDAGPGQPVTVATSGATVDLGLSSLDGNTYWANTSAGLVGLYSDVSVGEYLSMAGYGVASDYFYLSAYITQEQKV